MADEIIKAPFVKTKPISELQNVEDPLDGKILYYDDGDDLKTANISTFRNIIVTGIKGEATPDTVPTGWVDGDPDLFERYVVSTAGTYSHFIQADTNPVEVTADDLKENFVEIWVTNGVSEKKIVALPQATQNIPAFEDLSFPVIEGTQAVYDSGIWQVREGMTATISDIPVDDSIIWQRIGDRPKIVDTDLIFENEIQELTGKQVTASGTVANSSVGSIYGVSASIGIVPEMFNKVTIPFGQNTSNPVTEIEIRLFQGKTVGGTLIAKKRQIVSVGTDTQASAEITFDSEILYTGEMWVQILMNNPFAYKRVSPATLRTAADGFGQPYVSTTNDLDATSFPTSQGFTDLYLEFNKLQKSITTTEEGGNVILSSFTENVTTDITGDFTVINSYLNSTGDVIASTNWRTSEPIKDVAGKTIEYEGATNQSTAAVCMVGYKLDNSVLVLIGNEDHSSIPIKITIPDDIESVRACGYVSTPPIVTFTELKIFENLIPSIPSDKIEINKVWNCVGHSIWAQDGLVFTGTTTIAVGMQTLIRRIFRFSGYNKYCYSGRSLGATALTGDTNSITNYFSTWTDTSDGIWSIDTITNDFKRDIPIGTVSDYNNATGVMTYYGALRAFNDKVQSLTPGATIFCFNALRRNNSGYTSTSTNAAGHTLLDYEKAIMTIAALNGWIYIDQFRQSEITDETLSITTLDGLHPNNFGYTLAVKPLIRVFWIYANER